MDTCNMKFFDLFKDVEVTASGYAYSPPVNLIDTTDNGSRYSIYFSYVPATSSGVVACTLSYETSFFKDNGYYTLTPVISGTSVSGSFVVEDFSNDNPCVISGTAHGITTGQYIQLGEMGNSVGWGMEKGKIYKVTAVDTNNISLDGKDTSTGFDTYETTSSGTAKAVYFHYENLDPTWATPWIRFRVDESGGSDSVVVNAKMMVQ